MGVILKHITFMLFIFLLLVFFSLFVNIKTPVNFPDNVKSKAENIKISESFILKDNQVTFENNVEKSTSALQENTVTSMGKETISRAKTMAEVKWMPQNNMNSVEGNYTFIKGETYKGIPYSMGAYQASSAADFLSQIKNSKVILGNDCSGFVSAAWGVSRQTTLTLYEAVRSGSKVDGRSVIKISWEDLKAGDALLKENGTGKGHAMLYKEADAQNNDTLYVYEQNIGTVMPYEPIPTAREDIRSKNTLMKDGYFPVRLVK